MKVIVFFYIGLLSFQGLNGQLYNGTEMDFWIGEWDLTWTNGDGSQGKGLNKIERILNDAVILENFESLQGASKGYLGKSFSAFNEQTQHWYQTWVDSNGGYLPLEFKMDGDQRIFYRTVEMKDSSFTMRMVFHSIKDDSFVWEWQRSTDEGKTWTTNWKIDYRRI